MPSSSQASCGVSSQSNTHRCRRSTNGSKRKHKSWSLETKLQCVCQMLRWGDGVTKVSRQSGVPMSTLETWKRQHEAAQSLEGSGRTANGKVKMLSERHRRAIIDYFDANPLVTVATCQTWLDDEHGLKIARTTLNDFLKHKGKMTLKRVRPMPAAANTPHNQRARREWAGAHLNHDWNAFECIYLDEAGFNLHQTRNHGRSRIGTKCTPQVPSQRGANTTLLLAIYPGGVLHYQLSDGGTNADRFVDFFQSLMQVLVRENIEGRSIIMDNAPIHKSAELHRLAESTGNFIDFIPPYTPEFNACEQAFSKIKNYIGQQGNASQDLLEAHIVEIMSQITPENVKGWCKEVRGWVVDVHAGKSIFESHDSSRQANEMRPAFVAPQSHRPGSEEAYHRADQSQDEHASQAAARIAKEQKAVENARRAAERRAAKEAGVYLTAKQQRRETVPRRGPAVPGFGQAQERMPLTEASASANVTAGLDPRLEWLDDSPQHCPDLLDEQGFEEFGETMCKDQHQPPF